MKRILSLALAGLPAAAAAHPDHASGGEFGLLHFATDPFHLGITAAAALMFVVARRLLLRRRSIRNR